MEYTIEVENRDTIRAALDHESIGSAVYYPTPLHQQTGYRDFHLRGIDLERTESLSRRVLSLPMHPYLDTESIDRVTDVVLAAVHA